MKLSFGYRILCYCSNYLNASLKNDDDFFISRNTSPEQSYHDCFLIIVKMIILATISHITA